MKDALVQIYTGTRGDTTAAAMGLCVRARSRGLRVLFAFMADEPAKETALMEQIGIKVTGAGDASDPAITELTTMATLTNLATLAEKLPDYDLVVLDGLIALTAEGLMPEAEVVAFIKHKPSGTELVLTGPGASKSLISLAQLVTQCDDIKTPPEEN